MSDLSFKAKFSTVAVLSVIFVAVMIAFDGFVIVDPGERGVVVRLGAVQTDAPFGEGFHFKMPFVDQIDRINVQIKKFEAPGMEASSKDIQTVKTSCVVNYRINPSRTPTVRQELGVDPESHELTALQPALYETIKAVTARYNASELISKRATVSKEMRELFQKKLDSLINKAFVISEFAITNFQFSTTFNNAIEAKVKATERAIQAENEVRQAKAEAEKRIAAAHGEAESVKIRAQGEADAIRLRAAAFRENPEILKMDIVTRWDGKLPMVVGGEGSPDMLLVSPMLGSSKTLNPVKKSE